MASNIAFEAVRQVFHSYDANHDGVISKAEMSEVLQRLGFSEGDALLLFKAADVNSDGCFDFEEFLTWICGDEEDATTAVTGEDGAAALPPPPAPLEPDDELKLRRVSRSVRKHVFVQCCNACKANTENYSWAEKSEALMALFDEQDAQQHPVEKLQNAYKTISVVGRITTLRDISKSVPRPVFPASGLDDLSRPQWQRSGGDRAALQRNEVWVSPRHLIPVDEPVKLESLDVADLVNQCAKHTDVQIPSEEVDDFNATWREQLVEQFNHCGPGGREQLEQFLRSGRSNGWPLLLQVMALPPDIWFKCHAHPNIEFALALAGMLREVRLSNAVVEKDFGVDGGTPSGPWGPDLVKHADEMGTVAMEWELGSLPKGHFLGNVVGSVHQSFTGPEGATLLLLWSACHANILPNKCSGLNDLLRPQAGWGRSQQQK